jgi:lipopolysaccharide export system permease protein
MKLLDRVLFVAYLKAYLLCLVSLLSLYVVIDLFTNLEDFAQHVHGLAAVLRHIANYYGYKIIRIFDQLCEAIVLLAAMFTVAWVMRNNELLPLLSAGVPTRRVIRPVLLGAAAMVGLGIANQELVIPRFADGLLAERDDPNGDKTLPVQGAFEPNLVHIEGYKAIRKGLEVCPFYCTLPETMAGGLIHLSAKRAHYLPPEAPGPYKGGWLLEDAAPAALTPCPAVLEPIDDGRYFLRVEEVDFDALTRSKSWYIFASTARLREMLDRPDGRRQPAVAVLFHMRLTRPVLGLLLVVMGLSLILRDPNRNVFVGVGLCLAVCALFFAAIFACRQLGEMELLTPALAAWGPVLLFGPFAISMFDAIHT